MAADRVRMLDLARLHAPLMSDLDRAWGDVVGSARLVLGPHCASFEEAWARECGAREAIGTASGLASLTATLRALDVGEGDEVIVPAHTFIATWLAVSAVGATPVPVEVDEATYVLRADAAAAAVGPRTAAIIPVHLYGLPVDIDRFMQVGRRSRLPVVVDGAQAHGSTWHGRPVGGGLTATAWSFYPGKNLGALGDAGAVTTDLPELAARIRRLRDYGRTAHDAFAERGSNDRLDELQAALLEVKLSHLSAWQARRSEIAQYYLRELADGALVLPVVPSDRGHAWHQFVVRSHERDAVRRRLAEAGVDTGVHYPVPPHLQPAYSSDQLGPFPVAERLANEVISLPIAPHLDDSEVERVAEATSVASGAR